MQGLPVSYQVYIMVPQVKSPLYIKLYFLLVPSVECLSFPVWNDDCADSDTQGCSVLQIQ